MLVITLALTGAFKLNIIKFNKLKGTVNVNLCSEIPAKYQPRSESNPEGRYEYGFIDPKFYSAVVSTYNSDPSYCSTITEEQLKNITSLNADSTKVDNADGIEYLTGLKTLFLNGTYGAKGNLTSIDLNRNTALTYVMLSYNNLSSIDLTQNAALTNLTLHNNNLSNIDLSHNISLTSLDLGANNLTGINLSQNTALTTLGLYHNNLTGIDVSQNIILKSLFLSQNNLSSIDVSQNTALTTLDLYHNNLTGIDVSNNIALSELNLSDNNLEKIDLSQNTTLTTLNLYHNNLENIDLNYNTDLKSVNLSYNNLSSIDFSNNIKLTSLTIYGNNFYKNYNSIKDSIILDNPNVITAYQDDTVYSIADTNIATYDNGIVKKVNSGSTTLKANYKVSENCSLSVFYNILFIGLNSSEYKIDYENKTIDVKGNIFNKSKVQINSDLYKLNVNDNKLEILNSDKEVVDSYEIINEREKVKDAYKKAGFKDKNLYTCAVKSYFNDDDIEENYLLTEEEMQNINELYCINQNVTDTTGIEKLINLVGLYLSYNNIEKIDLSNNTNLYGLVLGNNNLTSLDVSKSINLQQIDIQHNNISKITGLEKLEELSALIAYNNNLSDLDISKNTNLAALMVNNNPLSNTLYMLKGKEMNYKKDLRLNEVYELKYDITDTSVISYKGNKLKAIKEGITNVYLSNENILYNYKSDYYDKAMKCEFLQDERACEELENITEEEALSPYLINQEVKVYDILSEVYKIDKEKKMIDASGLDLDTSKIKLTLEGLSATVSKDNFIIKDGETVVDTYKILNMKKVVNKPSNGTTNTITTKKSGSNSKTTTKSNGKTTTTEDLSDIEINGSFVSMLALQQVKGKDRNIVVKNDGITVTINGKDIDKVTSNIDLSYELKVLKESIIYEDVKDKIKNGMVLRFKNNKEIPYKMLIEIEVTDKIEKEIGRKNLYLYNYNNDKYSLVAEDLSSYNNKISFYVNKQGNYILTNNKIEDKSVKTDKSIIEDNTKLVKEINYKKIIIPIIIFILLIILGIIGYVRYKKKK